MHDPVSHGEAARAASESHTSHVRTPHEPSVPITPVLGLKSAELRAALLLSARLGTGVMQLLCVTRADTAGPNTVLSVTTITNNCHHHLETVPWTLCVQEGHFIFLILTGFFFFSILKFKDTFH